MVKSAPAEPFSPWGHRCRLRVGLLGGSFNPAHDGHRHAAMAALTRLGLDQVWFLVSPQNPLKSTADMAPQRERLRGAADLAAGHPGLHATGLEARLGTRFTVDTVTALCRRFPLVRFVWLMGADNLAQMRRWRQWVRVFRTLPIAVIDRPTYSGAVLSSVAARRFAAFRCAPRALLTRPLPAWTFLHVRRHPASASELRALTL